MYFINKNKQAFVKLIILASLTVYIYPFFNLDNLFPIHDNLLKYQFFHSFYSELINNDDFMLWMPYSLFGQSSYPYASYTLQLSSYLMTFWIYV